MKNETSNLTLTEQRNPASENLDELTPLELVLLMNQEDHKVAQAVKLAANEISQTIVMCATSLREGGRVIYVGAGTSGRLGVLDASECPPTFGVSSELISGIIAGGTAALTEAVEGAEDDGEAARLAISQAKLNQKDVVIGISSASTTRYVREALQAAHDSNAKTVLISSSPLMDRGDHLSIHIAAITGPEILTGSTRLKAGTATKMILNMISTGTMVHLNRSFGNLMVDVCCSNEKLIQRGLRMIEETTCLNETSAFELLQNADGHVKTAILMHRQKLSKSEAETVLHFNQGSLRKSLMVSHEPNHRIKAVFFDMDGTLVKYQGRTGSSVWAALGEALNLSDMQQEWVDAWKEGTLEYEAIWANFAKSIEGLNLQQALPTLLPVLGSPPYTLGARDCMNVLRAHYQLGIVSSGINVVSNVIKQDLELDYNLSNHLGVKNGVFDGTYSLNVPLENKKDAFLKFISKLKLAPEEICFVGDSWQDAGVLEIVGLPVLIHCKDAKLIALCKHNVIPDLLALPPLIQQFGK